VFRWYKKQSLAVKIFAGMILGSILGIVLGPEATKLKFIGDIFLNLLKMCLIPIILFVIISAVSSVQDTKTLGRIGFRVVFYYLVTTVFSSIIGVAVALIFKPGSGFVLTGKSAAMELPKFVSWQKFLVDLFPKNIVSSMADGNYIHLMVFAIFVGVAIVYMGDKGRKLQSGFSYLSDLVMSLVGIIISFSPVGVFCLMAASIGQYGPALFSPVAKLMGTFYFGCLVHLIIVYLLILWLFTKISPWNFIVKSSPLTMYTISTCSSTASIPINLRIAEDEFNVSKSVSSFTIPLGSQINKDGNGILLPCVLIFASQAAGVPLTIPNMLLMIVLATLMTLGGGGIPGSGIVKIAVVVSAFNLPIEVVAIMAGVYRLLDMGITTLNCLGDLAGTVVIDRLEKRRLDREKA